MPHALIVDDDPDMVSWLQEVARMEGFTSSGAPTLQAAREQLSRKRPDVVLTDLRLPDGEGIELARELPHADAPELIVVTGHASVDSAIAALRAGATDYLVKPAELDRVQAVLRHARKTAALRTEIGALRHELRRLGRFGRLLGSAPAMEHLYDQMARVAPTSATVLLLGESGTGKELVARAIYQNSPRANKLFIAINCTAIPENLLESELFGHERGSFTGAMNQRIGKFELGDGGTIFLDEIGDMPVTTQTKMLRVLQEGEFCRLGNNDSIRTDVRVIAATNKNLAEAVKNREFREDLFYRLNVVNIHLPTLAERKSDIPMLVQYFLQKHRQKNPGGPSQITPDALDCLQTYSWPGNVRELENVIQRAIVFATGSSIQVAHLPEAIAGAFSGRSAVGKQAVADPSELLEPAVSGLLGLFRRDERIDLPRLEQELASRALAEAGGDEAEAARMLGVAPAEFKKLAKRK